MSVPVFLVMFGVMFLLVGIQRLSRVATEERKGEAVLWGSVGVVLAVLFFGAAIWFFTGDRAEIQRKQLEIYNRTGTGHE